MLFNTVQFAVFFAVVFTVWWGLQRYRLPRLFFLLAASIYFYACWNWRYVFLLFGVTVVDWFLAIRLESARSSFERKGLVAITCLMNLGVLGFWKYSNFILNTLRSPELQQFYHWQVPAPLHLVLPVGISFFAFQGLGYVVDVYRWEMPAVRSLPRFFLVKAFFPQLVAGPIVRPSVLIPQFDAPVALDEARLGRGLLLVIRGLLKKALADYLAQNLVDRVFDLPEHYSSLENLGAIYGYALQIYGDFSGYTDIAIGTAVLLGFDLPANFDHPYRAQSLRDFWRRWHISLSTWLRDYLYIPLGGSRGGYWSTQRNLFLTMLLGGLWHGASWTFVLWGAMHGAGLVVERVWEKIFGAAPEHPSPLRIAVRGLITFHFVCVLWVFFRADSFSSAVDVLRHVFTGGPGTTNLTLPVLAALAAGFAAHYIPSDWRERFDQRFTHAPAYAQAMAIMLCFYGLRALSGAGTQPFIYFQF